MKELIAKILGIETAKSLREKITIALYNKKYVYLDDKENWAKWTEFNNFINEIIWNEKK